MSSLATRRRRLNLLSAVVLLATVWCLPLQAQQPPAVRVRVVDDQALAIPGALCSLTPTSGTSVAAPVVTDQTGTAVFDQVPAGIYTLRVEIAGFSSFTRPELRIAIGTTLDIQAVLSPAGLEQSVSVAAPRTGDVSVAAGAAPPTAIARAVLQRLPLPVSSIREALPLVPGVVRSDTGELSFNGASEEQSGLRVNGMNAADPASGAFRLRLPVDAVEGVQVFLHPYSAEHGQSTGALTDIDTRAGGERWRFELNDFLPDLRFVRRRIVGVAEDSPHLNLSGPLFGKRVLLSQSAAYSIAKRPVRGLEFPLNETRTEGQSYFTQLDFSLHAGHHQRITAAYSPDRREFVGLDVFRPRPVTPSVGQHDLAVTAHDNSEIRGGMLSSSVSVSHFDTRVWSQGQDELVITPTGERGNYFATQEGRSGRVEILEVYGLATKHWLLGLHDIKFGLDMNSSSSLLDYRARPVNITRPDGTLAERITFDQGPTIRAANQEFIGFVQDRWSIGGRLTVDLGLRYEDQRVADATVMAPRAGFAWTPWSDGSTVVRGGAGVFYDKVPLNIRGVAQYPGRTVTRYAADGVTATEQRHFSNVLVDAVDGTAPQRGAPTEFVPDNLTWNLQMDRTLKPWLAGRVSFVHSHSDNLYIVTPKAVGGQSVMEVSSTGSSDYRSLEVSGRFGVPDHAINVSFTNSRARGDLNSFAAAFGELASPVIRPNEYSQLPTDTPNRVLAWGSLALPRRLTVAPILEVRTGFPYAVRDAEQNFVGVRNADTTRFPRFVALDLEVAKELQVTRKYSVRLALRGFNLTNHFNPRDVHANTGDPEFGGFLASYRRYFAGGFDIVF